MVNNREKNNHNSKKACSIVIVQKDKDGNSILTPEGEKWAKKFFEPRKAIKSQRPDTLS